MTTLRERLDAVQAERNSLILMRGHERRAYGINRINSRKSELNAIECRIKRELGTMA